MNFIKVILVEDSEIFRNILKAMLDEKFFKVVGEAASFSEGILLLKESEVDIFVVDLNSQENFTEIISGIRNVKPDVKIVASLNYDNIRKAESAVENGVDDFIFKPFRKDVLNRTLKQVV